MSDDEIAAMIAKNVRRSWECVLSSGVALGTSYWWHTRDADDVVVKVFVAIFATLFAASCGLLALNHYTRAEWNRYQRKWNTPTPTDAA